LRILIALIGPVVAANVALAGPIIDGSVSGTLTANCFNGPSISTTTVSGSDGSSISLSIPEVQSPCDAFGNSTLSATTTSFQVYIGSFWGGEASVSGENYLSLALPANAYGYVEGVYTADVDLPTAGDEATSGLVQFAGCNGLVGSTRFYNNGVQQSLSGMFQSDSFLTGSAGGVCTISSNWEFDSGSGEVDAADFSYVYAATFVSEAEPVPESSSFILCIVGFGAVVITLRLRPENRCRGRKAD
jgi:hypothetical protein